MVVITVSVVVAVAEVVVLVEDVEPMVVVVAAGFSSVVGNFLFKENNNIATTNSTATAEIYNHIFVFITYHLFSECDIYQQVYYIGFVQSCKGRFC